MYIVFAVFEDETREVGECADEVAVGQTVVELLKTTEPVSIVIRHAERQRKAAIRARP